MRKTLLLLACGLMGSVLSAQLTLPKTWDFSAWALSSGIGQETTTIDELGIYAGVNTTLHNTGTVTASNYTFSDNFAATKRFQLNGAGYTSGVYSHLPTQRYIYFDVTGKVDVKIWCRGGGSGSRVLYVTDGSSILAQATSVDQAGTIFTATKSTEGAGRIYIFGDTAVNLMKIEVTQNTTLGTANTAKEMVNVFSAGNTVYVKNVTSPTDVSVFSTDGKLVKSSTVKNDVAFELGTGVYLVNTKSEKGIRSQKVLVK
ncbi:T9SS type A sorting domain-containing protein [Chryseobacterium koreense]